jgi:hypothetical protein
MSSDAWTKAGQKPDKRYSRTGCPHTKDVLDGHGHISRDMSCPSELSAACVLVHQFLANLYFLTCCGVHAGAFIERRL